MKSMINDYFGQSPKQTQLVPLTSKAADETTFKKCTPGEPSVLHSTDETKNEKENMKGVGNIEDSSLSKETSKIPPKSRKNKSLSATRKQVMKEGKVDVLTKDNKNSETPAKGFALKIRMKTKEKTDSGDQIEEFSSPEPVATVDEKAKDLKSPQGTMLKYLIAQKSPSPSENDASPVLKPKVNRDISDFFSPSSCKDPGVCTDKETTSLKPIDTDCVSDQQGLDTVHEESSKCDVGNDSLKTDHRSRNSLSLGSTNAKGRKKAVNLPTTDQPASDSVVRRQKVRSTVKSKSVKKSLSLVKGQSNVKSKDSSTESSEVMASAGSTLKADPGASVAQSMTNALKDILSKSSSSELLGAKLSQSSHIPSKKRKRRESEGNDVVADNHSSEGDYGDSPIKSRRRIIKTNQIGSDSDDDHALKLGTSVVAQKSKRSSETCSRAGETADDSLQGEEPKKNNLMKYFQKVSKEEVLTKNEKIEMKVKALVHSPPTTPSKKSKRRSVKSLPGGAVSLSKKKGSSKNKLKENMNAIEIIDAEEDNGIDLPSHQSKKKQATPAPSLASKDQVHKNYSPLKKTSPPSRNPDSSEFKPDPPSKSGNRDSVGRVGKQAMKSTSASVNNSVKSYAANGNNEENLVSPLTHSDNEPQTSTNAIPSKAQTNWKLRVCLTPQSLPSTQGTLLEEDSDGDDIFFSRRDKKRKLDKQLTNGESKEICDDVEILSTRSESPDVIFEKKTDVKVAPLFTRKADSQARQLFLQSGVPEQVKRTLETQRSFDEHEVEIFPKESHIQQKDQNDWTWNLPDVKIPLKADCGKEDPQMLGVFSLSDMTGCCNIKEKVALIMAVSCKGPEMRPVFGLPMDVVKPVLRLIKQQFPDYKVVSTFKALRTKCREEEFSKAAALSASMEVQRPKRKSSNRKSMNSKEPASITSYRAHIWTEKYKPTSLNEIVGNCESVLQLKRWLEAWRRASEDSVKLSRGDTKHKKKRKDSDDDDFVVSDNSSDGGQSNLPVGVAVLHGPSGSGKTSSVFALARDLGYKVLEVNASEKRNGKLVLSKLSEATQSHQVQQSTTSEQGFAALFGNSVNTSKNRKQKSKGLQRSDSEDEKTKKMSLILFEDVDVVFEEEDDGFLSAVSNLVSTSKRPVILTTTDPSSPLVSRFMNNASLMLPFFCPSNLISPWLQIVSILEGVYAAPDTIRDLVSLCKGDFRRALLQLQLWVMSGGNNLPMPLIMPSQSSRKPKKSSKIADADEMSDFDDESDASIPTIPPNPDCISAMLSKNDPDDYSTSGSTQKSSFVKVPYPLDVGLYWWNIPPLLSLKQVEHSQLPEIKEDSSRTSGPRRLLDDSFIASFCTDDGSISDGATNEESNFTSSQGSSIPESDGSQEADKTDNITTSLGVVTSSHKNSCSHEEMKAFSYQMNALSFIDIISVSSGLLDSFNVEPVSSFCLPILKDSLNLCEVQVDGPNFVFHTTTKDMCHWLAEQSLNLSRQLMQHDNTVGCSVYNYCLPTQEEYRWRDVHAETEDAVLSAVPLSVLLDHKVLATDYLPSLRTLCRLEKNRCSINTKRRNRFYHYLKSLGTHVSDSQLEILCRTMNGL